MSRNKKSIERLNDDGARVAVRMMLQQAIESGAISVEGKSDDEVMLELGTYVDELPTEAFVWVMDHRQMLLREARKYLRISNYELATLCYATWAEHTINNLLRTFLARKGLPLASINDAIRSAPHRAKFTWMLDLLDVPPLSEKHVKVLMQLAELRNAFVHYKWVGEHMDAPRAEKNRGEDFVNKLEPTVRYIAAYERRHLLQNAAGRIKRLAGSRSGRDAT